ncbi:MAG: VTT domain-containing protein [Tissierellia bacterium]|nr:VTT domain-containing protein [Tissierellia bacterium]
MRFKVKKSLPIIIAIIGIILFIIYGRGMTVDKILNYTPENQFMTAIFILIMFLCKSLTVMFPVAVIYVVTGILFTPFVAILINILGISISFAYSYWIGYMSEGNIREQLMIRYKKLEKVDTLMKNNEWVATFIVRIVGIVPLDMVSMFLGSMKLSFSKYMTASILGALPILVTTTLIGITVRDPFSMEFIFSILFRISISGIAIFISKRKFN